MFSKMFKSKDSKTKESKTQEIDSNKEEMDLDIFKTHFKQCVENCIGRKMQIRGNKDSEKIHIVVKEALEEMSKQSKLTKKWENRGIVGTYAQGVHGFFRNASTRFGSKKLAYMKIKLRTLIEFFEQKKVPLNYKGKKDNDEETEFFMKLKKPEKITSKHFTKDTSLSSNKMQESINSYIDPKDEKKKKEGDNNTGVVKFVYVKIEDYKTLKDELKQIDLLLNLRQFISDIQYYFVTIIVKKGGEFNIENDTENFSIKLKNEFNKLKDESLVTMSSVIKIFDEIYDILKIKKTEEGINAEQDVINAAKEEEGDNTENSNDTRPASPTKGGKKNIGKKRTRKNKKRHTKKHKKSKRQTTNKHRKTRKH